MLIITKLNKSFGKTHAVNEVSLKIPAGEMVGIIGSSGAGKSTLLRLINRLIDADNGSITYENEEITALKGLKLRTWRRRCAMIFQQFNLVNRLDVLSNVLVGRLCFHSTLRTLVKIFSQKEKAMAIYALDQLDMTPRALQRADTLSGGQQQRVAIARALVQEPDLILADEPIASLDPHNAKKVMRSLRKLNREHHITVICSLHHLDSAKTYCDRIIGMSMGKVVFDGPPNELTLEIIKTIYGENVEKEELEAALGSSMEEARAKEKSLK